MTATPTVFLGNNLDLLPSIPSNSIDAIVTDPPYGLGELTGTKIASALGRWIAGERDYVPARGKGFMGASWDRFVPPPALWDECLRVLKPGGHLAAFAGTRTQDLMGISIRLAGFELRDSLAWAYGTGMPHGQNLGKREPTLDGQYTALKPAIEPIVLARKPIEARNVAENILDYGTGGLQIDACRVPHRSEADLAESAGKNQHGKYGTLHGLNNVYGDFSMLGTRPDYQGDKGRFAPNLLLDQHQADVLDHSSGVPKSTGGAGATVYGTFAHDHRKGDGAGGYGDIGGASRFFPVIEQQLDDLNSRLLYAAKAGSKERPVTSDGFQHSTVKPLALMRWLVRLITPVGGTVLDPFAGSGSTLEAAMLEGFASIGMEQDERCEELIEQRITRNSVPDPVGA